MEKCNEYVTDCAPPVSSWRGPHEDVLNHRGAFCERRQQQGTVGQGFATWKPDLTANFVDGLHGKLLVCSDTIGLQRVAPGERMVHFTPSTKLMM